MARAIVEFFRENSELLFNSAAVVGLLWFLIFLLRNLSFWFNNLRAFVLPGLGIYKVDVAKYGSWAIVTGASEGIGRGYALELARRGLNVAILSRSEEKLNSVAKIIREKYKREARVIAVDFSMGQSIYSDIQAEISDLDVAVLVNNVGMSLVAPDFFQLVPEERHRTIIEINCQAMVQMTHLVIPKMAEKGKGIIINISSSSGISPTPLLSVYSGSKSFVRFFSSALQYEYGDTGIIVQCVMPFYVATALSGIRRPSRTAPTPESFVRSALGTLGYQSTTYGCFPHVIQACFLLSFPERIASSILFKALNGVRDRYLRKKRREQKDQ